MTFTAKRATLLAVAAAAVTAVVLPTAASASGGSLVEITDPSTSAVATVNSDGSLLGKAAVEQRPFATFARIGNNATDRAILSGPTTKTVLLSQLTVSATGGPVGVRVRTVRPTDGSCAAGHVVIVTGEDLSFVVPADTTQTIPFPSPLVAKPQAGHQVCLIVHADTTYVPASSATLTVSGSGYQR